MRIGPEEFPHLDPASTYTKTSEPTTDYNCIGWAVGDSENWWWPGPFNLGYWPTTVKREEKLEAFAQAFSTLGYERCTDSKLEPGFEKIALYGEPSPLGRWKPKHAARQLPNGEWTSKMGSFEDITHTTLEALYDASYGIAVHYFKRPKS
jgi:hypothetical protein